LGAFQYAFRMRLTQKDYKLGLDMKNVRNEFTIHN
jgi:hypothetical protein